MTGPWPGTSVPRAEGEDPVARAEPVGERAGPDDRCGADEQDVAGEHDARVRDVDDRVAVGVRGSDLDQVDGPVADREVEPALERRAGRAQLDALEGEGPEDAADVGGELGTEVVGVLEHVHELRRRGLELGGGARRRVDLGARREELVAEAVVAVAVRVHRRVDRAALGDAAHRVEHVPGELEVEERVDEQRRAVGRDQPRVAPAPAAVGLQVGIEPVPELVEPPLVRDAHGRCLPGSFASLSGRPGASWRGGRVVECGGLENRFRG